jgi:hypothetical protein
MTAEVEKYKSDFGKIRSEIAFFQMSDRDDCNLLSEHLYCVV